MTDAKKQMNDMNDDNAPDIDPVSFDEIGEIGDTDSHHEAEARIEQLEGALAETKDQLLRALADAENTRRRAVKEREDGSKYAIVSFARDLLSVGDNFTRALDAAPAELKDGNPELTALLTGIEATGRELEKAFEKHGIKKLAPQPDELFNPNLHEVMFEVPGTGKRPGTIMQVVETGYVIHDRLLRPARVGVAKDDGSYAGENPRAGHNLDTEA